MCKLLIIILGEKGSQGEMGWVASEKAREGETASGDVALRTESERAFALSLINNQQGVASYCCSTRCPTYTLTISSRSAVV
jgi:hypothetical protein